MVQKNKKNIADKATSTSNRLTNFFVDSIIFPSFIITILVVFIPSLTDLSKEEIQSLMFLVSITQIFLMEYFYGRSLGKFVTGTIVLSQDGKRISFFQAIIRTLSRFIPFDALSFLGKYPVGWHDSLSFTVVVDTFQLKEKKKSSNSRLKKVGLFLLVLLLIGVSAIGTILVVDSTIEENSISSSEEIPELEVIDEEVEGVSEQWQEYYLENDKFKIAFPKQPEKKESSVLFNNKTLSLVSYSSLYDGHEFWIGYLDISKEVNNIYCDLGEDRSGYEDLNKLRCEYYLEDKVKDMLYELFFSIQNNKLREIDKYPETFYGHKAYDFTWQNSGESTYIKGKVIIVDSVDVYFLLNQSSKNEFPDFERFIYSWEPYGATNNK